MYNCLNCNSVLYASIESGIVTKCHSCGWFNRLKDVDPNKAGEIIRRADKDVKIFNHGNKIQYCHFSSAKIWNI